MINNTAIDITKQEQYQHDNNSLTTRISQFHLLPHKNESDLNTKCKFQLDLNGANKTLRVNELIFQVFK